MKKLVLLGDSIRLIGYGTRLAEIMSDEYEVWQPEDNCRWADYTYRMLSDKAAEIEGADLVHWNNGHWISVTSSVTDPSHRSKIT